MLTLDPDTREALRHEPRARLRRDRLADSTATARSPNQHFERQLRADIRLNACGRLAWLLSALSHRHGSAYMAVPRMAGELAISTRTVRAGLHKLFALGLFEREPGRHRRPNKYRRARPPPGAVPDGISEKSAFVRWVRSLRALDLQTRATWLLADLCAHSGHAEISMAEIGDQLNTHENNARAAVRRLLDLGLFLREPAGGRGRRNRYRPAGYVGGAPGCAGLDGADRELIPIGLPDENLPLATPANFYEELVRWQKKQK